MTHSYSRTLRITRALFTLILTFGLSCCISRGPTVIPDAPPPYPSFPTTLEKPEGNAQYNGQNQQIQTTPVQTNSLAPNQIASQPKTYEQVEAFDYIPPKSQPPFSSTQNQSFRPITTKHTSASTSRFTLHANGELWALVQDKDGNELDWLKMKNGETSYIYDKNALIVTCSSGNLLSIKDASGRPISFDSKSNGISIIRLPR